MTNFQKRPVAIVAGGAGFIGFHLCRKLLTKRIRVICVDSFLTGQTENVSRLSRRPDISAARHLLDWSPPVPSEGLKRTIAYCATHAKRSANDGARGALRLGAGRALALQ